MSTIGTVTASDDGTLIGTIKTLELNLKLTFVPNERRSDNSPDYRVYAGDVELGAAWAHQSPRTGREYMSVTLDDPSFPYAVNPTLVMNKAGTYDVIWARNRFA